MPSIQQRRHEALAYAVERATREPILLTLANVSAGPLDVRVECFDRALVGAVAGIGAMLAVDKWEGLYEWILLYDSAGAAGSRG